MAKEPEVLNKEAAVRIMSELTAAIRTATQAAENHASKYGLSFSMNTSYGMGGYYMGEGTERRYGECYEYENVEDYEGSYSNRFGWNASSNSC